MKAFYFSTVLAAVLMGCGSSSPVGKAQSTADQALAVAQRAMAAHDDGITSGTTLAGEVEEAGSSAANAQGSADNAQLTADAAQGSADTAVQQVGDLESRIDDLESRIDLICSNAPNAC